MFQEVALGAFDIVVERPTPVAVGRTPTGKVIIEETRPRPVLFELNQMHLNASKGLWTVLSDIYAVALILMALTGMFVLRGPVGLGGRGKWLVGLGALIPIGYWVYTLSR